MQFSAFESNIEGSISHLKLRNCWVAKKVMSHAFFATFRVFKRGFLWNHSVYRAQLFRDNWNCYALSIFRGFILLASSDYEAENVNKDSLIVGQRCFFCFQVVCAGERLKSESETGERHWKGVWNSRASRVLQSTRTSTSRGLYSLFSCKTWRKMDAAQQHGCEYFSSYCGGNSSSCKVSNRLPKERQFVTCNEKV